MKKFVLLSLLFAVSLYSRDNCAQNTPSRMQLFKGLGFKIGFATHAHGWNHPDPNIPGNYYDSPKILSPRLGIYLEILSKKRFSTIIDYSWNHKTMEFEYPTRDSLGNITGSSKASNTVNLHIIAISEKFKVIAWSNNKNEAGAYLFCGLRGNFQTSVDAEYDFQNVFDRSKSVNFGLWTGVGGEFGYKHFSVKADFYFAPDFTKTIETAGGWYRNIESGVTVSLGYNILGRY